MGSSIYKLLFLVLLNRVIICHTSHGNASLLHVLTILSVEECSNRSVNIPWIQGRDIFDGAIFAAQDINNHPHLLQGYKVVPIPVLVPDCDPVKGIDQLLKALLNSTMNVVGVTGMFCDKVAEVYTPIMRKWKEYNIQTSQFLIYEEDYSFSFNLPSYEDVAFGVFALLRRLNWTRFNVVYTSIRSHADFTYWKLANFLITTNWTFHPPIEVVHHYRLSKLNAREINSFVEKIKTTEISVFIYSVSPKHASLIIKTLVKQGLLWPQYVWIFVFLEPSSVSLPYVWENVIFMFYKFNNVYSSSILCGNMLPFNFYGDLLYDSMWAVALTLNNSFTSLTLTNTSGPTSHCNFKLNASSERINFNWSEKQLQLIATIIKNHTLHVIGQYNFATHYSSVNLSLFLPLPPDKYQFIYLKFPLALSVFLYLLLASVFLLVTANLIFFIIFRKEQEVKASSVSLSMCIFVGNYLMLISGTNYALRRGLLPSSGLLRQISCNMDFIGFSVGVDLAVATALVKTFRIWHIFHHFSKLKNDWTDSRLVLIIIAIISIKIYLFVLWITVDNVHVIDKTEFQNIAMSPYYLVFQSCYCEYFPFWLVATCTYTSMLLIFLFHLAIKTRNINHKDFKDTKKTAMLVICQLMILLVGGLFWGLLRTVEQRIASYTSLTLSYILSVFLIQIFLFLPKVFPPLCRYMSKFKRSSSFQDGNHGVYHLYK